MRNVSINKQPKKQKMKCIKCAVAIVTAEMRHTVRTLLWQMYVVVNMHFAPVHVFSMIHSRSLLLFYGAGVLRSHSMIQYIH